ncbi:MAG: hypothetical protein AAFQ71_15670 [Planctomycetota bacterium]
MPEIEPDYVKICCLTPDGWSLSDPGSEPDATVRKVPVALLESHNGTQKVIGYKFGAATVVGTEDADRQAVQMHSSEPRIALGDLPAPFTENPVLRTPS